MAKYIFQFWHIVKKLRSFFYKFNLNDNFLIYHFRSNQGLEHRRFYERYTYERYA